MTCPKPLKAQFECIGQAVSTERQFNTKATVGAVVDDAKIETVAINRHPCELIGLRTLCSAPVDCGTPFDECPLRIQMMACSR